MNALPPALRVATDTATICLFDLQCLQHRKDDVGDWWSIPQNEIDEINRANVLILNLGTDGVYEVAFLPQPPAGCREFQLKAPSGRIFVGPGEELSGGGFEPSGEWGGGFVPLEPGVYKVSIARNADQLEVCFQLGGTTANQIMEPIRM